MRTAAVCVAICLVAGLRLGAQDRSTPEGTVRSFLSAFARGDIQEAVACVKGAQYTDSLKGLSEQIKRRPATFTLTDAKTSLNGDKAVVTGQVSMQAAQADRAQTGSTEVSLESSGGTWLIVPNAEKARRAGGPDMVNAMAYVLTDSKVFDRAHGAAQKVSCLSNVKQIALGAMMFVQDEDGVFKLKAASYKKSLMPYIKNEAIFKCPADKSGVTSYSFNASLAGVPMSRIKSPAETVMIYEGRNGKLDFRHGGEAAVGFADGHCKDVTPEAAKKLRWKP
jgi:prepilin-type processing-associated H-X9-DG protein